MNSSGQHLPITSSVGAVANHSGNNEINNLVMVGGHVNNKMIISSTTGLIMNPNNGSGSSHSSLHHGSTSGLDAMLPHGLKDHHNKAMVNMVAMASASGLEAGPHLLRTQHHHQMGHQMGQVKQSIQSLQEMGHLKPSSGLDIGHMRSSQHQDMGGHHMRGSLDMGEMMKMSLEMGHLNHMM